MIGPEQTVSETMRDKRRNGVIWLAVALVLAITLGVAYKSDQRAQAQDRELADQTTQVETLTGQVKVNGQLAQAAKDAAEEGNRRLKAAGEPTVPVPTVTPVGPASPAPQSSSLTIEDVRAVVAVELAQQDVKITQAEISQIARTTAALVPKPADGKTPTTAEMQRYAQISVAAYCAGDRCRAPIVTPSPGPKGDRGDKGEKGDPAPKITDEELLASAKLALAAYCAQDNKPCDGKPGADGTNGKDAPTIADMDCVGDDTESYWRIQFSTGPDRTALGPCRIGPDPN